MLFNFINIIKNLMFVTGSYSNNVFLEPLSKEEEEKYVNLMLSGDMEARNVLIERNLRLVAHIVKSFNVPDGVVDDLISIGTIGLIKGIDSYAKNHKTKITTYASRCIQNEILMYFRSNKNHANDINLSDAIGFDKEGNEIALIDVIEDNSPDLIEYLFEQENFDKLRLFLNKLTKREYKIICMRYGLNGNIEKTQKEISKELHISRSYVSRIEKRALTKILRQFIDSEHTLIDN